MVIGLLLALLIGVLAPSHLIATSVLVLLGILAGIYNISDKNMLSFLVVSLVLWNAGSIGVFSQLLGPSYFGSVATYIGAILLNIAIFVGTASIIVAIKYVYNSK